MKVKDLNRDEIISLKRNYLINIVNDEDVSFGELVNADSLISDDTIYTYYGDYEFSEEDFSAM
jgi:hypothetical protein